MVFNELIKSRALVTLNKRPFVFCPLAGNISLLLQTSGRS